MQPQSSIPDPSGRTVYHRAATACGFSPLIAFGINFLSMAVRAASPPELLPTISMVVSLVVLCVIMTGLGLGIFALFGIRKHGKEGIFGKAITGISINLAFIALAVISVVIRMRG